MKKKNKVLTAIIIIVSILFVLVIGITFYIKNGLKPTKDFLNGNICYDGHSGCEVTPFVVDEGAYGMTTIKKLETENIIKNADLVYYWNRIFGGYSFYAGYYEIPHKIDGEEISLEQLLGWLSNPNNAHQSTVTIKLDEGDFARSFAKTIAENVTLKENANADIATKTKIITDYWNNYDTVKFYMNEYPFLTEEIFNSNVKILLEGYLFPDTYEFYEYTDCDELTRKILDRTLEIYNKYINDFNSSKLSYHQIFTLASICQWETGNHEDSKKVAGVFLNRIDNPEFEGTGGKLESTVTACYAFDFTKTQCDQVGDVEEYTHKYDPYNTYTIEGFPPGPVCCPNEAAIYAALNPDQEAGYYFFVANMCEGGTAFARTLAEHEYNIDRFLLPCLN